MLRFMLLVSPLVLAAPSAQDPASRFQPESSRRASSQESPGKISFPEYDLTLELPSVDSLVREEPGSGTCKGEWTCQLGGSSLHLFFNVLKSSEYGFLEPEDVVESWRDTIRDPDDQYGEARRRNFAFGGIRCVPGAVGCAPFLAITQAAVQSKEDPSSRGTLFLLGGLLEEVGYSLRVDAWPALDEKGSAALARFLEQCVRYGGKGRDPKWTEAEVKAYWQRMAPESMHKKLQKPVRTEHYLILSNSSSADRLARKVEGYYKAISKVLPIQEVEGRKLMPLLLFRTQVEFAEFYVLAFDRDPKEYTVWQDGVAAGVYYATSLENVDDDADHLMDMTRQILINRARAWGACLWFRSGLRWYLATKPGERDGPVRAIKKRKHTHLEKLLDNSAWGEQDRKASKTGVSDEADYWDQSALWIEFLRESPWAKDKFGSFVQTLGTVRDGDRAAVVAALEGLYGVDLMGLENKWIEYCLKR